MLRRLSWGQAVAVGMLVLAGPPCVSADPDTVDEPVAGSTVRVPAGRTIDREYLAVADRVEIAGTINGDAHILARHVVVSGTVNGDLLVSGGTVQISGIVAHNARVLSGRFSLTGEIGRNLTVTSGQIELAETATIHGALVAGGFTVHVGTPVARSVAVAGRNVTLAAGVGEYVNAAADSLEVSPTADIAGRLSYLGNYPPAIHDQARIGGPVTQRAFPTLRWPWSDSMLEAWIWLGVGLLLVSALSTLVLGLVLMALFPQAFERTVRQLGSHPLGSGGIGLLVCLLTPVIITVLTVSLVGLPLAFLLVAVAAATLYIGRVFTLTWVGRSLLVWAGSRPRPRPAFLIGLGLYYVLRLVPILGIIVGILAALFGIGAIVRTATMMEDPTPTSSGRRLMAQEFS